MFELLKAGEYEQAAALRESFLPIEDIRDTLGPARVLHAATTAAGIAECGPIPPFTTELTEDQKADLVKAVKPLEQPMVRTV
jgi:dihydrodipicolinate synthase/N-acetylneuraminate lyase